MRIPTIVPLALLLTACAGGESQPVAVAPSPAPVAAAPAAAAPAAAIPTGTLPGNRVPSFSAKVRRAGAAAEETFDLAAPKGATVLVVMSTTCPNCAEAVDSLRRAETAYQSRGVDFAYLYPMKAETAEEKAAWHAQKGFTAGFVDDRGAAVSRLLQAAHTPTAYLVDARGVLLYRGSVLESDAGGGPTTYRLADAIDEHLAGKAISVSSSEPAG